MGLFHHKHEAEDAYGQVYNGGKPPHELTHELLAGAAGFEAVRMYEKHREREGIREHHELGKEMLAGFAAAEVEKLFDKHHYSHLEKEQAKRAAREQAHHLWEQEHGGY